ncbi:MAG: hypothetical protein Q4F69_00055 [Bacteroidia bacterium]|nr:hypothetical protein [Bacteroidia bacterium]
MVNGFLRRINVTGRVVLLLILAYFSCYVGWRGFDSSLVDGKNLVNFLLIYSIGDTLRLYAERIKRISVWLIAMLYVFLNVLLVVGYILHPSSVLYSYAFPYNSIVLLLNAILFFVLFMHLKIESKFVNGVASSMLAVYLIHGSPLIFKTVIQDSAYYIQTMSSSVGVNILGVCLLAALCMVTCVLIDKAFTPVWTLTQKMAAKLDSSRAGEWLRDYAHVE